MLPSDTPFSNALTCQRCGSHDPSVRQVIYPYVVSVFVFTFRHEFHGRWCRKHRTFYLLLAVLITSTIGWLGFPFGLIYASSTLFRLARGLVMHKASNLKLLRSLVDSYEQRGLLDGARGCLEASFQFTDDLWGRQKLASIYVSSGAFTRLSGWRAYLHPSAVLFAVSIALSGPAGLLSFYADKVFDLPIGGLTMVFGPLFFWMPLAAIAFGLIFTLRQVLEAVLEAHPYRHPKLSSWMALCAGLLAAYGFLEGRQIGNFLDLLFERPILPTGAGLWNILGALLTRGGFLTIPQALVGLEWGNFPHHVLLVAIPLLFPAVLVLAAGPFIRWEELLNQVRAGDRCMSNSIAFPFHLAPYLVVLCLGGAMLLFRQQEMVDFIQARDAYYAGNITIYEGDEVDAALAIRQYERAIQLDPLFAEAYVELGWAKYLLDDNAAAITNYQKAIALKSDQAAWHYDLGNIYFNNDQIDFSLKEFEQVVELDPTFVDAHLALGWITYNQGDLTDAEIHFHHALDHDNHAYDAYVGLGYIYEDQNRLDEEIAAYQQAVQSDMNSAEGYLLLGMAYYDKNELDQAVEALEKAARLDYENQVARAYLIQSFLYTGQIDHAVEFARQTIVDLPEWPGAHALLSLALVESRQYEEAMSEVLVAGNMDNLNDMDGQIMLQALLNAGENEMAIQAAGEAIQISERPGPFYLLLAEAYQQQGKHDQALAACDQAEQMGVRSVNVLLHRASIHLDQSNPNLTLEEVGQALLLDPNNSPAHYLASLARYDLLDLPGAIQEARQAVDLDRYYYSAQLNLAADELEVGNTQVALQAAKRAVQLSPYADLPHFFLGMAYLQDGQTRPAATELFKYLEMFDERNGQANLKKEAEDALKGLDETT